MSGARTIATTLTAWLILTALGFAACSRQEPPMPLAGTERDGGVLVLADTVFVRTEVFSDDAIRRLEQRCIAEGGEPCVHATFVRCERGGPSRAGWTYSVSDVPDDKRWAKR